MELSAPAIDYLILNIAAPITAVATTGTVEAAEGLEIPTIPAGRWLSARAVNAASAVLTFPSAVVPSLSAINTSTYSLTTGAVSN